MNINEAIKWDEVVKLWNHFDDRMYEKGYRLIVHNGEPHLPNETIALKDDKYAPYVSFMVFQIELKKYIFSIQVTDRNGNNIVTGKSIAFIRFSEYTLEKLDEAIDYVLETFGCYNENNTVPTKFDEIEKTF